MLSVNVRRQVFNGSRNITNNNNIFIMTTEQKFDCVFCKETFDDKETLQIHFRKHGDPKFDLSTKVVKNRTQNESTIVPAEKAGEEIEMVGCDVCEEVFPTISKAITHKHKAHPKHDAKYFCPFCGKLFTMKHLLNKHIQSNHNAEEVSVSKDFHCDMCDVTFNVASAMLYHNKFFHRQDTEIPAIGISKKVKLFSQEMLQIYYCSFCGEEFNNKVNLHKHIGDDHCDENHRPSEVLRCPLCEAIFFHLDAYEIHLTFHSSEDIYSEKNELVSQITEFSLETVAPIMESVEEEDLATQPEEDDNNSDVVSNFLQLVMGDQGDNVSMEKVKHKKHKKHKKSKKASITLDEFLNMNKDVFGDGLGDVQGIEEVPTQVVLKKVKGKAQIRNESKMVNADLAKLKKQGIVIKAKPKFNSHVANQHTSKAKQLISGNVKNNTNILQKSPNDIISKLLNQGNSQIKIIKKSTSQNVGNEHEGEETVVSDAIDNSGEQDDISDKMENKKDSDGKSNIQETPSVSSTLNVYSKLSDNVNEIRNNPGEEISRSPDFNGKDTSDKLYASESSKTSDPDEESTLVLEKKTNIYDDRFANPVRESLDVKPSDETKPNFSENHFEKKENDDTNLNNEICDNSDKETATNNANKAISVLKHLSHLITVKPLANQNKSNINEEIKSKGYNSEAHDEYSSSKNISSDQKIPLKSFGQITLKTTTPSLSVTSPVIPPDPESDAEFPDDIENNDNLKLEKKNIIEMKELQVKLVPLSQSLCDAYLSKNNYAEESNDFIAKQSSTTKEDKEKNVESPKKTCNLDILKRLSNVTAKPVNITKAVNQQVIVKPHRPFIPQVKSLQSKLISKGIDEEIEVFNIDDSDEETEENTNKNISEAKPSGVPTDVIKNLSRNITVKSSETKTIPNKNIKIQTKTMRADSYSESYTQIKQSKEIQKSINLQNKLKTLGHITVKPNNSAPKLFNEDFDDYEDDQADSGSDSENIGRVKISEINDDYMSDSDLNDVQPNAVVQSPNPSNSENEDNHDDFNDDLSDFESHIKMNTLKKNEIPVLKKPMPNLDNLKNLNKALTIKSLNAKNAEQVSNPASNKELSEDTNKPPHEMALKLYKPNISQNEQPLSNNIHQASGSSHQTALNQKVNAASNQVNTLKTVNTVKRFQSQTVIEEITTTVTKTIRTVNSSTNEVMQSTSQNKPKPINRPQKIINKQPGRELQGTPVRHISPTIGTKIRNAVPVARAPNATIVRPSNQLVPVRPPVFSRPRCPTPGTSAVRKVVPPRCSPQKPAIGKLKISPHALNQTTKRPSDEGFAHFACFKKPKDSFIGPQDLPDCSDDESAMQYSSTQSRSEFSTVTKKAKGMVTATQTKSEVSTSCQQQVRKGMGTATQMRSEVCMSSHQQLSKLNSMSGLKVVKTSSKQATQVEEKCELSPGKRNTLEAIEKLQRQGLLVKKPRIEEDQGNSFSESDDEFGEK
ncbi:putative uncharacterized protein DDB_G0282133 [Maniola jurtina]|uniref:putative uncharacterized protein DDB_G0282133 n=1 Tax=Maniola jurtina TaxID=191418 RepID=UPI001E68CEAB|nr:putative uncharacterized protein DDB_G0282133 [Maniola jurtina]